MLSLSSLMYAQTEIAITESGKKVILYSNGTWKYKEIKLNIPYGWKIHNPSDNCGKQKLSVNLNNDGITDYIVVLESGDGGNTKLVYFISSNYGYKMKEINSRYAGTVIYYDEENGMLSNYECETGGLSYKWNGRYFVSQQ